MGKFLDSAATAIRAARWAWALAKGDDDTMTPTSFGEALAGIIAMMNDGDITPSQTRAVLRSIGVDDLEVAAMTRVEQCVLVVLDEHGKVDHIEAPSTMTMSEACDVLRSASMLEIGVN